MKTDLIFDSACPLTAALLLTVFLLSGCAQGDFSASEKTGSGKEEREIGAEETPRQAGMGETPGQAGAGEASEEQDDAEGCAEQDMEAPLSETDADYILPDAQKRIYSEAELSPLSDKALRLARNEIYARHGRRFQDEELSAYFSKKKWYHPMVGAEDFDESVFSDTERSNLKQIKFTEEKRIPLSFPDIDEAEFPKIDGSTATLPISQTLYRLATGADLTEAQEKISHSKTTAAYHALLGGAEDSPSLVIAYAPDEEMLSEFSSPDSLVEIKPVGRDALVFMTNSQNPVRSLTQKEIRGIYSGKILNWKECGGPDKLIEAFQRPEGSGSQNLMEKLVMQGEKMAEAPQSKVFSEMGEILDALSSYDNAEHSIGYSVYYYARNMYERPQLSFISVDGVTPSNESIRSRKYPYTSAFYAAIRKDEPKESAARKLYDWLTSDDGQAALGSLGYVGETEHYRKMPESFEKNTASEETVAKEKNTEQEQSEFVYVADGDLFWGEQGTLILDEEFRFLKFLPDMVTTGMKPLVKQELSRPLVLLDMSEVSPDFSVPKRIYRADKNTWEPFTEEKQEDSPEQFALHHPDILKEYDVADPKEIVVWQSWSDSNVVPAAYVFSKGGNWYAYDAFGSLTAKIDARGLQAEMKEAGFDLSFEIDNKMGILIYLSPPLRLNEEMSLLTVGFGGSTQFLHYFKNGREVQKVKIQPKDESSYIVCAGDGFYLERSENYLSIYSLDGKLMKRFLDGWLQND